MLSVIAVTMPKRSVILPVKNTRRSRNRAWSGLKASETRARGLAPNSPCTTGSTTTTRPTSRRCRSSRSAAPAQAAPTPDASRGRKAAGSFDGFEGRVARVQLRRTGLWGQALWMKCWACKCGGTENLAVITRGLEPAYPSIFARGLFEEDGWPGQARAMTSFVFPGRDCSVLHAASQNRDPPVSAAQAPPRNCGAHSAVEDAAVKRALWRLRPGNDKRSTGSPLTRFP